MLPGASDLAFLLMLLTMMNAVQQTADAVRNTAWRLRQQPQPQRPPWQRRLRRPAIPRVRVNPILAGLNEREFMRHYRLDPRTVMDLLKEQPLIEPRAMTSVGISAHICLLAVLNFLAMGSFQHTIGALQGMAQPTMSRILHQVIDEICRIAPQHIYMPVTDTQVRKCKLDFYLIAHFPKSLGAIDCTHIPIVPPSADDHIFRNKGDLFLNIQMVCDANLVIWNICARYPGSGHDSRILMNTWMDDSMTEGPDDTWLLGDSAYRLMPWLLTPLRAMMTAAEERYNRAHIVTRSTIERAFGVIKSRWHSLHKTGGALLYAPEFYSKIVLACVILHNICVRRHVPLPEDAPIDIDNEQDNWGANRREVGPPNPSGLAVRQRLIDNVFPR